MGKKFVFDQLSLPGTIKEYGILYAHAGFPKGSKFEWLNYCAMTNILPKDLQEEIKKLSEHINSKYRDVIIIPMDNRIVPGCVITPEYIDIVAKDIYEEMKSIFKKLINNENCVRLVYSVGQIHEERIKKAESAHEIGNYPVMVKVGRFLDSSTKAGIFKI